MSPRPRIAFFTGQSDPGRCALSPAQRAFLDALDLPGTIERVPCNFPWDQTTSPWRPVPLLRASLANGRQYLAARRGGFAPHLAPDAVIHARESLLCAPRTLLLVGSCGLSLLDALIASRDDDDDGDDQDRSHLEEWRARLRIVAYGAVGPRWPVAIAGEQLRGRRDWVAACAAPREAPPPLQVNCGHLDYLDQPALRARVEAYRDWLLGDRDAQAPLWADERRASDLPSRKRTA